MLIDDGPTGKATPPTSDRARSVLMLAGEYPPRPGGVGDYTALLVAHLAAQGVLVTVLTSRDAPAPAGVGHVAPGGVTPRGAGVRVWRWAPHWNWRCARVVLAAVAAARPDVVHVQYQPAAFDLAATACWLPGWLRRRCPARR